MHLLSSFLLLVWSRIGTRKAPSENRLIKVKQEQFKKNINQLKHVKLKRIKKLDLIDQQKKLLK